MNYINKVFDSKLFLGLFMCLFLMIYFNNETLSNNLCTFVTQPCAYVALIIIFYYIINRYCFINKTESQISILFRFVFFISILLNGMMDISFSNGYLLTIMNIFIAFLLSKMIRFKEFSLWYINIIVFLCICSLLITYPLASFVRSLPLPRVINSAEVPFINAYFCYLVDFENYFRNTGIFREAGVWGAFVLIALMIVVENRFLFNSKQYLLRVIILISTVISTFSTACLVVLAMIFLIMMIKRDENKTTNISNIWLLICAICIIFVTLKFDIGVEALSGSMDKLSENSSSMDYRTDVINNSFTLILNNPFGYGILRGIEMLSNVNTMDEFHNTSTFVSCALYFGWLYFLFYVIGIFMFCYRRLSSWLYVFPLFMLLNAEQYIYNPIFYLLIFYGLQNVEQENLVPLSNL